MLRRRTLEPRQCDHRRHPEHVAEHRGLLEQVALLGLERRDPRFDRFFDRDRQLGIGRLVRIEPPAIGADRDRAVVEEQPHELFEERRIAAGHLDRGLRAVLGNLFTPRQQIAEHQLGVIGLEVAQVDPRVIAGARAPTARAHQHLGPRRRQQHDRRAREIRRQIIDHRERIVVGPLQIIEHDDERAHRCIELDEAAQRGACELAVLLARFGDRLQKRRRWKVETDHIAEEIQNLRDLIRLHHVADLVREAQPRRVIGIRRELEAIAQHRRHRREPHRFAGRITLRCAMDHTGLALLARSA